MIDEIEAIERQILDLQAKKIEVIDKVHALCNHPIEACREGEYVSSTYYSNAQPEMRVCMLCGYAEEGWGCGFWKLRYNYQTVEKISRELLFQKYVKKFWTQEMLCEVRFDKVRQAKLIAARDEYYRSTGREVPKS